MKRKAKKEDTSEGIELNPLSDPANSKILTAAEAFSRPFHIQNLVSPTLKHIQIKAYVDFYGGYAEHARQVILRLHDLNKYEIKLTPIKTPIDIDPITWQKMNNFIHNPSFKIKGSKFLCIAGPGHFQERFLPKDRDTIGWTMIETLQASDEVKEWVGNCSEVWCPTDADMRRFDGLNTKKVHLGFDHKVYHKDVKPLDIVELRGKYVFGVFGSWNRRKGIREIIQTYCQTFAGRSDVALFLFCKYGTRPHADSVYGREKDEKEKWTVEWELNKYLAEIGMAWPQNAPQISILDVPVHDNLVPHLLKRMDCLVGFSRGESTWLPGLCAMAMKIPIIQLLSDCSGFSEYLSDSSYMCREVEYVDTVAEDYLGTSEYYEGGKFAEGNTEELGETMRLVMLMRGNKLEERIVDKLQTLSKDWTWEKSIDRVNQLLLG